MFHAEQTVADGSGPWLERRYFIDLARPRLTPPELMAKVQSELPSFSPELLADFKRKDGGTGPLQIGDEFDITILGPWNGAVRVIDAGPTSFEFVTLEGHPEAGYIRFEAHYLDAAPDVLRFEINSRARSRDGLVAFAYDTIGGGKLMQEATWVEFCNRVAEVVGGQTLAEVAVETHHLDESGHSHQSRT